MRLRPSIEAVGYQTRQPLPKTARSGGSRYETRERRSRICENRTQSFEPKRLANEAIVPCSRYGAE
jgi:hypothetical protein